MIVIIQKERDRMEHPNDNKSESEKETSGQESKGGDVNLKRKDNSTLLHIAATKEFTELAELLVDRGADLNAATAKIEVQ